MKARRSSSAFARRLRVSEGFRTFALDQLAHGCDVTPRAMFGAVGLYAAGVFFGILAGDTLYLRASDKTRKRFEDAGAQPFEPYPGRAGSKKYFSVPVAVLEDVDTLERWVKDAIRVAAAG